MIPDLKRLLRSSLFVAALLTPLIGMPVMGKDEVVASAQTGPGWFRGDLHSHSGHSDGSCESLSGNRVPCPVFLTLQAAVNRGLDFLALSDHNTITQFAAEQELQPYFDTLLLIPGREITTFHGHANVYGTTDFIPFHLGTPDLPDAATLANTIHAHGGLISINHPNLPSDERCMGCGWTAPHTPYDKIDAIEVVNGGTLVSLGGQADSPLNGIRFWEARLNEGYHITGVGGSDNHDPTAPAVRQAPVGYPTTVVYATSLDQQAILTGLKSGRVFIDLGIGRDRRLDLKATAGNTSVVMGQTLTMAVASPLTLDITVVGVPGGQIEIVIDGKTLPTIPITSPTITQQMPPCASAGSKHWVRVNVRNRDAKIEMLSNPIYINCSVN